MPELGPIAAAVLAGGGRARRSNARDRLERHAAGQPGDRQRSVEAGFDQHLVKPIDLATLERFLPAPR
jgi:hypothetical protein